LGDGSKQALSSSSAAVLRILHRLVGDCFQGHRAFWPHMVEFGNVKPTGTLVEIRLCMKGSASRNDRVGSLSRSPWPKRPAGLPSLNTEFLGNSDQNIEGGLLRADTRGRRCGPPAGCDTLMEELGLHGPAIGRGPQLRSCPLVMTFLRAAKFNSRRAARSWDFSKLSAKFGI
jgi:hypothetical protein